MQLSDSGDLGTIQHLLHEVDAAAWAVELVAKMQVGRTSRRAKSTVHATAQDGIRLLTFRRALDPVSLIRLHVQSSGYIRPGLKIFCGSNSCFNR